jgi:hypothetical protein
MELGYFPNIDDFLGVRQTRYFGDGYLKSSQTIRDFELFGRLERLEFRCLGAVQLPDIWSQKGDKLQVPHLSTIDVIEFALEVVRLLQGMMHRTDDLLVDGIHSLAIASGDSPVEDDLSAIAITGFVEREPGGLDRVVLSIANMKVTVKLYPDGFAARPLTLSRKPVRLDHVLLNVPEMQAAAMAISDSASQSEAWSLAASFACALQLGQLLLYKLDNVTRANSNTLWMKRTDISISERMPRVGPVQPIHASLDDVLKYQKPDGMWRRANVRAAICNVQIICRVTHRLPGPEHTLQ